MTTTTRVSRSAVANETVFQCEARKEIKTFTFPVLVKAPLTMVRLEVAIRKALRTLAILDGFPIDKMIISFRFEDGSGCMLWHRLVNDDDITTMIRYASIDHLNRFHLLIQGPLAATQAIAQATAQVSAILAASESNTSSPSSSYSSSAVSATTAIAAVAAATVIVASASPETRTVVSKPVVVAPSTRISSGIVIPSTITQVHMFNIQHSVLKALPMLCDTSIPNVVHEVLLLPYGEVSSSYPSENDNKDVDDQTTEMLKKMAKSITWCGHAMSMDAKWVENNIPKRWRHPHPSFFSPSSIHRHRIELDRLRELSDDPHDNPVFREMLLWLSHRFYDDDLDTRHAMMVTRQKFGTSTALAMLWVAHLRTLYDREDPTEENQMVLVTANRKAQDALLEKIKALSLIDNGSTRATPAASTTTQVCILSEEWCRQIAKDVSSRIIVYVDNFHEMATEDVVGLLLLMQQKHVRLVITGVHDTIVDGFSLLELFPSTPIYAFTPTSMIVVWQQLTYHMERRCGLTAVYVQDYCLPTSEASALPRDQLELQYRVSSCFLYRTNIRIRPRIPPQLRAKQSASLSASGIDKTTADDTLYWLPITIGTPPNYTNGQGGMRSTFGTCAEKCVLESVGKETLLASKRVQCICIQDHDDECVDRIHARQVLLQQSSLFNATIFI